MGSTTSDTIDNNDLQSAFSPRLIRGEYVFCTISNGNYGDYATTNPLASFKEEEGRTLIVKLTEAQRLGLQYNGIYRCITLGVNSSPDATDLHATISRTLMDKDITAHVVAAYYYDYVFVPLEDAERALHMLQTK